MGRQAAGPRPAAVRCNDWRRVRLPEAATFEPTLPVSVVVPCYEAPDALALTLAGLEGQAWPRGLFEVVIVDDGSEPPLKLPALPVSAPLEVKLVRQERRGFGLARARNAGARAAAHPILVFLDGDVITGIDDHYEAPANPDLAIDTAGIGPDLAAERIFARLESLGYLR